MSNRTSYGEAAYDVEIVVPTIGRSSLAGLLARLRDEAEADDGIATPLRVIVVDDRPLDADPLALAHEAYAPLVIRVLHGGGRGPAAARNTGWHASAAAWIAFLDDDVLPESGWLAALREDLHARAADVAGSQGRIVVPLPSDRAPTDCERNVAGLENARWATADLAYRRAALAAAGGFDQRFPRAYREDADLGLRLTQAGWRIVRGRRATRHPVGHADAWASVRRQAGNADDVLMRALHGRGWRHRAGAPRGRRARHVATSVAGVAALASVLCGHAPLAATLALAWLAGTGELAWRRIAPGPRDAREVARMLATSVVLPFAATWHTLRGVVRVAALAWRGTRARRPAAAPRPARPLAIDAVLLDRDGTIVVDVPDNGDPTRVEPMPDARAALDRLRTAGVRLAVVSNQCAVARGCLTLDQVAAVNGRIERELGPFAAWLVCPHGPDDRCFCRKPAPGMVLRALGMLGVDAARCALVGDTAADLAAADAAGVRAILVPNAVTRREEVAAAPEVAHDLDEAVSMLLGEAR